MGTCEIGWLIERSVGGAPCWLVMSGPDYGWTANANDALRLARKSDAEALLKYLARNWSASFLALVRVSQHVWAS